MQDQKGVVKDIEAYAQSTQRISAEVRRRIAEIGQVKASEITGIAQSHISTWLSGRQTWSPQKIVRICKQLIDQK